MTAPSLWYFDVPRVPSRQKAKLGRPVAPGNPARGSARFRAVSVNRKLAPVAMVMFPGQPRPRPIAQGPFVSATYASIEATCPDSCEFKRSGCFADSGFTKMAGRMMDEAARGSVGLDVIREEARLIKQSWWGKAVPQDGARGGRDLRLHVGGDIADAESAAELGRAATNWRSRGGGAVWSFTHRWRTVNRSWWGPDVSVLASVEHPREVAEARRQGYPAALVVADFMTDRAYPLEGVRGHTLIPCPAETRGATCASCRLCLDRDLFKMRVVIGFKAHGVGVADVKAALLRVARRKS